MLVLLIDDNTDVLITLSAIFESLGCEVKTQSKAFDILQTAEQVHPDLIIMDIGMPDMNGYEVCKILRKNNFEIPIIAHTGWGSRSDKDKAYKAGFDDILVKPVDYEQYEALVSQYK